MAIKCVIFDLGDTIWNTKRTRTESEMVDFNQRWLKSMGFKKSKAEIRSARMKTCLELRAFGKMHTCAYGSFSRALLRNLGIKVTKSAAVEAEDAFYSWFDSGLRLMPNARKLLSWLDKRFIVLVMSNAHTRSQLRRLNNMKLMRHFDKVFTSESLGHEKSSIVPFKVILKWLKPRHIKAGECLMVGNDYIEDTSAKKVGMKTVIITVNAAKKSKMAVKPDYEIKNLIELKKIIRGIGSQ